MNIALRAVGMQLGKLELKHNKFMEFQAISAPNNFLFMLPDERSYSYHTIHSNGKREIKIKGGRVGEGGKD